MKVFSTLLEKLPSSITCNNKGTRYLCMCMRRPPNVNDVYILNYISNQHKWCCTVPACLQRVQWSCHTAHWLQLCRVIRKLNTWNVCSINAILLKRSSTITHILKSKQCLNAIWKCLKSVQNILNKYTG